MCTAVRPAQTTRAIVMPRIKRGRAAAFTYLWVLVTVALISLAGVTALEMAESVARHDQEQQLLFVGHQFRRAIMAYHETANLEGARDYPNSLEELIKDSRVPGIRRYLREIYPDPMTGHADWELIRLNGKVVGVHSVSARKPIKQAGFDSGEEVFADAATYADWVFTWPANLMLTTPGGSDASAPASASSPFSLITPAPDVPNAPSSSGSSGNAPNVPNTPNSSNNLPSAETPKPLPKESPKE